MKMSVIWKALTAQPSKRGHGEEPSPRNRQAGMTLLEIMIVLAILGLIMGLLIGPVVFERFGEAREDVAKMEMQQLVHQAHPQWSARHRKACPPALQDLTEYTNKKDVKDPWGNDYVMHCGESAPANQRFGVSSAGEDGKTGTQDDIKSWEDKAKE